MIPTSPSAVDTLSSTMTQNPHIDVLGGVYPMRRPQPEPIVVKERGAGVWWGWEDGGVHRVYMTGTGFTMIRTASLKKLDVPEYTDNKKELALRRIFGRQQIQNGNHAGRMADDEYFAELCTDQGLSWYVAGNVVCDQIDIEGRVYRVADAKVAVA